MRPTNQDAIDIIREFEYIHYNSSKYCSIYAVGYSNDFQKRSDTHYKKICEILSRTEKTEREYDNMSAEWLGHNICYTLHIKRDSTRDVDLDYIKDSRWYVRAGAKALEILGWD